MLPEGFVYLDRELPEAFFCAMYAGDDNFMGRPANGYKANRVVLSREACRGLKRALGLLRPKALSLFVFDAYRPARAVRDFCAWAGDEGDVKRKHIHYPNLSKQELLRQGYIASRSGHSRGSAVDLTLCDLSGNALDMGGIFDFMDPRSWHDCPFISPEQTQNRETLRRTMLRCGFEDYSREWWHYLLKNEPYPDTYFDFEIE